MIRRLALVATLSVAWGSLLVAQQTPAAVRYRLRLADLVFAADTLYGLELVAQPASRTVAEGTSGSRVWLRFDPEAALSWLNAAAAILQTPMPNGPTDAVQWSPTLRPVGGSGGGLLLGRHRRKGRLEKERYLAVADSAPGWQAEIGPAEADSILRLVLVLSTQSRLDTLPGAARDRSQVDRPVALASPAREGSNPALVQFVVGTGGEIEAGSFRVLWAGSPRQAAEAWELIRGVRFAPAQHAGRPVRQLVQQAIGRP